MFRSRGRRAPLLWALGLSLLVVGLPGCGVGTTSASQGRASSVGPTFVAPTTDAAKAGENTVPGDMATSPVTSSSTSSSTSTTTPVSIPPDLAVFKPLVERLQAQGVAVTELRPMPTQDYGPGVEVVLRSLGTDDRGTPEDAISSHLVYRAAIMEKMAGMAIDSVGVVIVSATGERLGGSWVPLDREIDPVWYEPATMSFEEAVIEKQKELGASLQGGPFTLKEVRGETDPDGTRVLWVIVSAPTLAEANAGIGSLLTVTFPDPGDRPGSTNPAKIGVIRTRVYTDDGTLLIDDYKDLQLLSDTAYIHPGITNYWFPSPAPLPAAEGPLTHGSESAGG